MKSRLVVLGAVGLLMLGACLRPTQPAPAASVASTAIRAATQAWLASLRAEQSTLARVAIDAEERTRWAFVPGERAGLRLSQMDAAQRSQALAIITALLSVEGARQVQGVIELEALLHSKSPGSYDPDWYDWLVFGDPTQGSFGLRIEGHHLSVQWMTDGKAASFTPWFVGAAPFQTENGYAPLGRERELGFALWNQLSESERAAARIAADAPGDVTGVPGADLSVLKQRRGLSMDRMSPAAKTAFRALLEQHALRLQGPFAQEERQRLLAEAEEELCLIWAGSDAPDGRHYWCLRGSFFAIEFDCTSSTDHVHHVWHDFERDHGNALRAHLAAQPHATR